MLKTRQSDLPILGAQQRKVLPLCGQRFLEIYVRTSGW
jgi:hypothetical protein